MGYLPCAPKGQLQDGGSFCLLFAAGPQDLEQGQAHSRHAFNKYESLSRSYFFTQ